MSTIRSQTRPAGRTVTATGRIGCVSFLNAKPLIDGLEANGAQIDLNVPSKLLADLEAGRVDIALCPVIDFYRSATALEIVPAGAIGCWGPTLTVILASAVPLDQMTTVHSDTDSHTSIALLQVILAARYGTRPRIASYTADKTSSQQPESVLLIGDKVVTAATTHRPQPYQLDLGEAWHELTGLPFVFAVWMTRQGTDLGDWPARLADCRKRNLGRIEQIVQRHARAHGWPDDLALQYLGANLCYDVGPQQLQAIETFAARAQALGLIHDCKPLHLYAKHDYS